MKTQELNIKDLKHPNIKLNPADFVPQNTIQSPITSVGVQHNYSTVQHNGVSSNFGFAVCAIILLALLILFSFVALARQL